MSLDPHKESPFGKGTDWNLNACVGENGGPYGYKDYASGYFEVANHVAKELHERGRQSDLTIDVGIYPLLYLYRQGIELMLKHYIYFRSGETVRDAEHNLHKLWNRAEKEMKSQLEPLFGAENLRFAFEKIQEFTMKMHSLDPNGEVMRFPENLSGESFLQDYSIINIGPIYELGQQVGNIFTHLIDGCDEAVGDMQ